LQIQHSELSVQDQQKARLISSTFYKNAAALDSPRRRLMACSVCAVLHCNYSSLRSMCIAEDNSYNLAAACFFRQLVV